MAKRECQCPADATLELIGGRWKVPILWELFQGKRRFSELRRLLRGACGQKVLTQHLREMERDGLVKRKIYAQVPPKVEYSLTPAGKSLKPVVDAMVKWAAGKSQAKR
jgi:DNA-binding HxlR family transcriptional regulator